MSLAHLSPMKAAKVISVPGPAVEVLALQFIRVVMLAFRLKAQMEAVRWFTMQI